MPTQTTQQPARNIMPSQTTQRSTLPDYNIPHQDTLEAGYVRHTPQAPAYMRDPQEVAQPKPPNRRVRTHEKSPSVLKCLLHKSRNRCPFNEELGWLCGENACDISLDQHVE